MAEARPGESHVDLPPVAPRDARAIAAMDGVQRVFVNPHRWWQNASFALPVLLALLSLAVGQVFGLAEATGFGLFMVVVSAIMIPVVLLTWRSTATAVVLTTHGATALHLGTSLHTLAWSELKRIEKVEYLGNTRYKLVHGEDDRFLTVETELQGAADLVELAFALSGLPRQHPDEAI